MNDDRVGTVISHYRVGQKLGGGGMGVVYRAEDLRLRRHVALKFLPPWLSRDGEARERFEREAQAASALDHPAICTIHDIEETADGQIFIAMTLYEGETLKNRLARGPLAIDEALTIAAHVASGLSRAHEHGIIHRDIKPANLMLTSDGDVKILDFGLAKLAGRTDLTLPGMSPGTVSYMAPEQIAGDAVDARADVWALGVVLYEMIAGRNPFERDRADAALAATLAVEAAPLSNEQLDVPDSVRALVEQAMRKDPDARPSSAREFADRLERIRGERIMSVARPVRRAPVIVAGLVVVAVVGVVFMRNRARSARELARLSIPRIAAMIDSGRFANAYALSLAAARALPDDTVLARLLGEASDVISIASEPPGARIRLLRFDPAGQGDTIDAGLTPVRELSVPRGDYILRLTLDGYAPVERALSSSLLRVEAALGRGRSAIVDSLRLIPADRSPPGMVFVPGGRYELVSHAAPRRAVADLDDFFMDRFEVSNRDFLEFIRRGGYSNRSHWKYPFVARGLTLDWEAGVARLVDATGLPGPRNWQGQQYPAGHDDDPVTGVSWYEAAAYAEFAGKTLPTLFQWEKVARDGRIVHGEGVVMPWGHEGPGGKTEGRANFAGLGPLPVAAFPFGMSPYGAYAMAGNVREWTASTAIGGHAATGGSWRDPAYLFNAIGIYDDMFAASDLGFRCSRPVDPTATRAGAGPLPFADRTPQYEPVGEATFRTLLSHYNYDRRPLNATVIESVETPDWVREKITFDAPGNDRVLAYLFLPKSARPPFQTLAFIPGSNAFYAETAASAAEWLLGPLIRSGRAILAIVLDGMVERPFPPGSTPPAPESVAFRDLMVRHAIELRRALDLAESRTEVDTARIAYVGVSFGAGSRLVLAGVDDRFDAIVLIGGGIDERLQPTLPEASSINFAPWIRPPKLLLNGTTDDEHPWLTRGLPLWNLLREPKELVLVEGAGHIPQLEARIPAITNFLDRLFGPVVPSTTPPGPMR